MSNQSLLDDVLQFAEKAGEALLASHDALEQVSQERQKAAQILPKSVDALATVKTLEGTPLIAAEERDFARRKLASHAGALEVLRNVLDEFQSQVKQASQTITMLRQGQAAPEKAASAKPPTGLAALAAKPESWRRFEEQLGL